MNVAFHYQVMSPLVCRTRKVDGCRCVPTGQLLVLWYTVVWPGLIAVYTQDKGSLLLFTSCHEICVHLWLLLMNTINALQAYSRLTVKVVEYDAKLKPVKY